MLAVAIRRRWAGKPWALFAALGVLAASGTAMVSIGLSTGDLEFWRPRVYSLGFRLTAAFCAALIFRVFCIPSARFGDLSGPI